jgi:hypothetical protein
LAVHYARLSFVSALALVGQLVQGNKDKQAAAVLADVEELAKKVDDPRAKALREDVTGQVFSPPFTCLTFCLIPHHTFFITCLISIHF